MVSFLEDVWEWSIAVLTYWQAYATAGIVAAILAAIEKYAGVEIPRKLYLLGAAAFLVVSCFMVWRDVKIENVGLIENIKQVTDVKKRNAMIRENLNSFLFRALHIQQHYRGIYLSDMKPGTTPDSEFNDWHKEVRDFLDQYLPSHVSRFENIMTGANFIPPPDATNPNSWGNIEMYKTKLEEFLKEHYDSQNPTKS